MPDTAQIIAILDQESIDYVHLWFTDVLGGVKNIVIPRSRVERVLEKGMLFDGSAVEGGTRAVESDMLLRPDPETFMIMPWGGPHERTARLICTVHTPQGDPFPGDPRTVLMQALDQAQAQGFNFKIGLELEFFIFQPVNDTIIAADLIPYDDVGYFDLSFSGTQSILREMVTALIKMGIEVTSAHHEIGSGQYEIDLEYDDALTAADKILTARVVLKAVAQQHGLHCTFMPRPRHDLPGSGMHTHQSLHDAETGANLFVDLDNEYGLSAIGRQFLAGQLFHARGMVAVLAPLVNSYKRLGTSFEAPVHVTWANINRAALIRVPSVLDGNEDHTRLELRCPDPSNNPYLSAAVMLMAGLDGIRQQLLLPEPLEETLLGQDRMRLRHTEVLPASLGEALDALEENDVVLAALGPHISDSFVKAKRQEFDAYNRQVTVWEMDHYISRY